MALKPGARIGSYEVTALLGAGGMGEVYRARDARLNRDVALKVLPAAFADDPDRLARFVREAQVLASLNHPNIAHIHGLEDFTPGLSGTSGTVRALVLELVEGPTLADRIARGPMALREALPIAAQIAEALDAAHEQGIIHRDLKPANVKVRDDGTVKVLDFGLAKALAPDPGSSSAMNSPTITARATEMGMILGTAAYMSPEQAKGKSVDRRADVWAFGVVLFEMLTGGQLFGGDSMSEVMASVMKDEPDWSRLPPNLPPSIRRVLRRCLEKDPKRRLSSMSDVRLELSETDANAVEHASRSARGSLLWLGASAIAGALVAAIAFLFVVPSLRSTTVREPTRVSVLGPEGVTLQFDSAESAISPDGRMLVFSAVNPDGSFALWVRPLATTEAHLLAGAEGGHLPFWSPDSRQIGFFANDKLKKISAGGGNAEPLCDAKDGRGGTWGSQNVIVFAPDNAGPLLRVSANGGDPQPVTTLDAGKGETGHRFPWFLPDGRHFLFATLPAKSQKFDLFVGSIDGTRSGVLMPAEGAAVYADPGYLLFTRKNVLVAQAFDAGTLQLSGEPMAIGDAPGAAAGLYTTSRPVSVSTTGALAYLGDHLPDTKLVWLDRSGRETGTLAATQGRYQEMSFSPDGRRAALVRFVSQNESDIWIVDLARGGPTRFAAPPGLSIEVVWSPDGSRLLFSNDQNGSRDFFVKPASGASPEELFYGSKALFKDSRSWSSDGKTLVFEQLDPKTNRDLWILPMEGDRTPKPYLRTPFNEVLGAISPNGRWLAYVSDESGRNEVYVDSYPTPSNKYLVTEHGAFSPQWGSSVFWRNDGQALAMFSSDARSLLISEIATTGEFHATKPHELMPLPRTMVTVQPTPDLQRVLAAVPVTENSTSTLTVVFDWRGALQKR